MWPISIKLKDMEIANIQLGYVGENDVTPVIIDCESVFSEYPNAVPTMTVQPPKGLKYPAEIERDGNNVIWTVQNYDLNYDGEGEIQIKFTENGKIKKSASCKTTIKKSIEPEAEAPTPIEDWMERAEDVLESLDGLTVSAETLDTGEDATAEVSEDEQGHKHIDFGLPRGPQGPGPSSEEITEAVDDYLESNFTNPSNPPLDRSLLSSLSAAPADMVGNLKSAFTLTVGNTNDGYKTILLDDWEFGGYNASGKYSTGDKIRIKTLIPVEKGKTYVFKYNGVAFDTVRYTSTEYAGGTPIDWGVTEDKTYTMGNNYYWGIALRTSDLGASKLCVAQKNVLALAADAIGNTEHSPSMIQYGTDSGDGSLVPRNDRICTELKFRVEDIISISINDGYQFIVAKFNDNDEFLGSTSWGTSIAKSSISGTNFRVTVKANNGGNISPSTSTGLTIKLETQNTTGLLLKGYKEIEERKAGDNALKEQIEGIKSVVDADSIGINQIARLGWKPYAAYYPPEQSLASYKLAYAMGMRILLADLRKTSDGVFVCIHDESINSVARNDDGTELSSTVNVADHTLAELNEYDYGIKKGWPNEGLLTLDEFLKLCGQINCIPVIETKIWLTVEETENLCLMVRKYGLQDGFIWAEMPDTTIANRTCTIVRNMLPNAAIMIRGGAYSDDALNDAIAFSGAGKKTILSFTDFDYITAETVATCREHNIDIQYSQVDTISAMDTLYANSHFSDVRYWVSAEFNVHDYIMEKIN